MSTRSKTPPEGIPLAELIDDDPLPPIADDAADEADPEELAGYLDAPVPDAAAPGGGDEPDEALDRIERELISIEEGSWIEESAGVELPDEPDVAIDDDGGGWSGDRADEGPTLDDDWFEDEPAASAIGDGGEDGPLQDGRVEIDRSGWDDLEGWEEGEDEPIDAVMERLGISLPGRDEPRRVFQGRPSGEVESAFLGPDDGCVVSASTGGSRFVAVGDGVFLLGGDDTLHRLEVAHDLVGTSAVAYRELTFIGTARHGMLVMSGTGGRLRPMNGWNNLGMTRPPRGGVVETPFFVDGQRFEGGFRLVGRDGSGQLFASVDLGATWTGPLSDGRCLAMTMVGGSEEVLAAMIIEGEPYLLRSRDLARWTEVPIPERMEPLIPSSPIRLAATARTLVVGAGGGDPRLFVSLDGGRSWREVEAPAGVDAVAVDPQDPAWIAMAAAPPEGAGHSVRVSRDGGILWKTVAVCCPQDDPPTGERAGVDGVAVEQASGWVQLAVRPGPRRVLFLVTPAGVHRLSFSTRETSH